jgi:RNA polymerase sigma-70 factor (ECF subfamily)
MSQSHENYREAQVEFLLEQAKKGEKEAFMEIVARYQQKIFILAYSMTRNREDSLDLVQETFMRLFEKLNFYRAGESFEAWLLQISKNLCVDFLRKQKSRRKGNTISLEETGAELPSEKEDPARFNPGEMIQKAVLSLPEKQRLVFILHHFDGLKYEEIAERLKIASGTVKSLHFKAIQKVRAILAPQLGGGL